MDDDTSDAGGWNLTFDGEVLYCLSRLEAEPMRSGIT